MVILFAYKLRSCSSQDRIKDCPSSLLTSLNPTFDFRHQWPLSITTDTIETDDGSFTAAGQSISTVGGAMNLDALGTLESELYLEVQGHAEVCITWVNCFGDFNYDFQLDPIIHTQELTYDSVQINHTQGGSNSGAGTTNADGQTDEGAAAASGGCSTVPVTEPSSILLVLAMAALAYRRRQSPTASEKR